MREPRPHARLDSQRRGPAVSPQNRAGWSLTRPPLAANRRRLLGFVLAECTPPGRKAQAYLPSALRHSGADGHQGGPQAAETGTRFQNRRMGCHPGRFPNLRQAGRFELRARCRPGAKRDRVIGATPRSRRTIAGPSGFGATATIPSECPGSGFNDGAAVRLPAGGPLFPQCEHFSD